MGSKKHKTGARLLSKTGDFFGRRPLATKLSLAVVVSAGIAVIAMYGLSSTKAASVSDTMSPATQTVATGSNVTVTITTDASASHVLTDELRVTYDSSKLEYVSADYSGSPLDTDTPDAGSFSGYFQISRYSLGTHPTGSFTLAKLTFKVLATSGSSSLGYDAAHSSVYIQEDDGTANALTSVSGTTYTFDGAAPTISITTPANNATISGATTTFAASASDNVGVTKVEFSVDGSLKATDTTAPYSTSIDTSGLSIGGHSLSATAYDLVGHSQSATVTVTVSDTTRPTLTITSPVANATVAGPVTVAASASDNVGVTKVEFSVDGSLKATDTTAPYSTSIDTTALSAGSHTITVTAYDAANNTRSRSVDIVVNNKPGDANSDGHVTIQDIAILIANYNQTSRTLDQGDVNGDGKVNIQDLAIMIAHYGQ